MFAMDTRSGSSSPDPLGYPGNPEYLLSSATKPRRISFSPLKAQTPRRGRPPGKRSPLKSAKKSAKKSQKQVAPPIRYEDIILPSTPTGPTRFDRTSLSPTKATLQSDGNISPWRIRVTVEAERDEEEQNANNVHNGPWTETKTTKVPLKGGLSSAEPTPKRRRTQKSKSDISERVPTPSRRRSSSIAGKPPDSVEKTRKSKPAEQLQLSDDTTPMRKEFSPLPVEDMIQSENDPFLDLALDNNTDDASSIGEQPGHAAFNQAMDLDVPNPVPRNTDDVQPEYPILPMNSIEDGSQDQRSKSTVATSSPVQPPGNVIDAGRTPKPKSRIYPTPISSSLLDEDGLEKTPRHRTEAQTKQVERTGQKLTDPTEQHREFDSIMESEGFSMVSLDTLPSRQLNGLHPNLPDQSGSPYGGSDQNSYGSLNKFTFGSSILKSPMAAQATAVSERSRSHLRQVTLAAEGSSQQNDISYTQNTPSIKRLSPRQPPPAPALTLQKTRNSKRRPWARLARVVRAGIALQGLLSRQRTNTNLQTPFSSSSTSHADDVEATKKRLDNLFQGFNSETQRELRAGLRFGEQLAKRSRQISDKRQEEHDHDGIQHQSKPSPGEGDGVGYPEIDNSMRNMSPSPSPPMNAPRMNHQTTEKPLQSPPLNYDSEESSGISMDSVMARRQAEWQREREEISQRIAAANSSQVVVIDSDVSVAQSSNNDQEIGMAESEPALDADEVDEDEQGVGSAPGEATEDDGFEDIWQQEARGVESQPHSPSFTDIIHEELPKPRRTRIPSPWRRGEDVDYAMDDEETRSLPDWSARRQNGVPILTSGKTKMSKYRDQDASLSSLVGTPETITRNFYEGNFIPANATSELDQSPERSSSNPEAGIHHHAEETQLRSASSPLSFSEPQPASLDQPSEEESIRPDEESLSIQSDRSFTHHPVSHEVNWEEYTPSLSPNEDDTPDYSVVESILGTEEDLEEDVSTTSGHSIVRLQEPTATATWFNKLTSNIAPAWLTSTPAATKQRKMDYTQYTHSQERRAERSPQQTLQRIAETPSPPITAPKLKNPSNQKRPSQRRPKPLALSGYFTDGHYVALRRIYREAKDRPDRFVYQATPERDALIGKWMWSADNIHRRQITEIQIAIVDRFINDLVHENKRRGGDGKMGWSELDILWRLFSIIVGEQLRRERKREAAIMNKGKHATAV